MEANLLDRMLTGYLDAKTLVTVTLQNKVRVTGKIRAFDSYVIIMDNHKRDIVYRHAVSSVAASSAEPQKQPLPVKVPAARTVSRPPQPAVRKHRPAERPVVARQQHSLAAAGDAGLNTSMKEGLLKWMQEQKAAK